MPYITSEQNGFYFHVLLVAVSLRRDIVTEVFWGITLSLTQ